MMAVFSIFWYCLSWQTDKHFNRQNISLSFSMAKYWSQQQTFAVTIYSSPPIQIFTIGNHWNETTTILKHSLYMTNSCELPSERNVWIRKIQNSDFLYTVFNSRNSSQWAFMLQILNGQPLTWTCISIKHVNIFCNTKEALLAYWSLKLESCCTVQLADQVYTLIRHKAINIRKLYSTFCTLMSASLD